MTVVIAFAAAGLLGFYLAGLIHDLLEKHRVDEREELRAAIALQRITMLTAATRQAMHEQALALHREELEKRVRSFTSVG
jgi:hypothetical protein